MRKKDRPTDAQAMMAVAAAISAATTMTGADLDEPEVQAVLRESGKGETRVVFNLTTFSELEWLVEAAPEAMIFELGGDAEDEEERPDHAIFCQGASGQAVQELVDRLLLDHHEEQIWRAVEGPVPVGSCSEHQVRIVPQ